MLVVFTDDLFTGWIWHLTELKGPDRCLALGITMFTSARADGKLRAIVREEINRILCLHLSSSQPKNLKLCRISSERLYCQWKSKQSRSDICFSTSSSSTRNTNEWKELIVTLGGFFTNQRSSYWFHIMQWARLSWMVSAWTVMIGEAGWLHVVTAAGKWIYWSTYPTLVP